MCINIYREYIPDATTPLLEKYIEQSSMYGMVWHGMVCMYTCRYVGMYVCM